MRGAVVLEAAAAQEEVPRVVADGLLVPQDLHRHEESIQQLVGLEEPAADANVRLQRDGRDEGLDALRHVVVAFGPLDGLIEELLVRLQRHLIHVLQAADAGNHTVDQGAPRGHDTVPLPSLVNLLRRALRHLQVFVDLFTGLFTLGQSVDQHLVLKNVVPGRRQQREDLVLQCLQLRLALGDLHHELVLLHLQLRPLKPHDIDQKLVLQTFGRDSEVDDGGTDLELGHVVGVRQFGGDEELEVGVVVHVGVAQADQEPPTGLEDLLGQNGVQGGIQLLPHVLQQHRNAHPDAVLERPEDIGVVQFDDLQALVAIHVLDPLIGLALRIDHEAPPPSAALNGPILDGDVVQRQPLDTPLPDGHGLRQAVQREVYIHRHAHVLALLHPVGEHVLAVLGREGPEVRDGARSEQHVAHEVFLFGPEARHRRLPPDLL
mmetsp:Transcript_66224/g.110616  ORF Transcript_66224/g.110616 Transcript_66224/m.110616 type:complete len:433 (-) Transcript_66224:1802-3100(-)